VRRLDSLGSRGATRVTGAWTQYYCNFDSGSQSTVKLYIGDGGGTHLFDDIQVY
jgi:hypothetical protein